MLSLEHQPGAGQEPGLQPCPHSWVGACGSRAATSGVGLKGGTPGTLVRTWPSHQAMSWSWEPRTGRPSGGCRGDQREH